MVLKSQSIRDELFLSDEEAGENEADRDKHLVGRNMAKGDLLEPKVETVDSHKAAAKLEQLVKLTGETESSDKDVIKVEGELKERCDMCGKKVADLDKHIIATHKEEVQCQLCDQTLTVVNLRWHILKEHVQSKVVECSLCDQKFATKNALKSHIKEVHLSETSTCSICQKEYKDLYHHVKFTHDKIRNYECSYCKKRFQAKKLLYNHVQSIHLGEKTNCPDCKRDISVDNFRRHVKEFHEGIKKPCPQCGKEFGMANQRRHIRQVHNNESTKCPDCGKALTISNLNKHIQSVHNKLKKICGLCNKEIPHSSISIHKRRVHKIGKPVQVVKPRGPNLKLRKTNIKEECGTSQWNMGWVKEEREGDIDKEGLEDLDLEVKEDGNGTEHVGDKNFTWVDMMSEPFTKTGLLD